MTHPAVLGQWVNALGGALVVLLGVFVLSVKPRRDAGLWFGLFAIGFGSSFVASNSVLALHVSGASGVALSLPALALWLVACVRMAFVFPRPVQPSDRGRLFAAGSVALLAAMTGIPLVGEWTSPLIVAYSLLTFTAQAALLGFLVLLVLRFIASREATFRRQAALTAAGLTLYVAFVGGYGRFGVGTHGVLQASGADLLYAAAYFAVCLGVAGLWLAGARGPGSRFARNMAWLTLTVVLGGIAMAAWLPTPGAHGVGRILMVGILAYAVLQHQLLGIDVKVRWTISKTTLAAIFVAVFFIASEAAQEFFGETLGSAYVGILAAGLLVFAIAPLSKLADRVAEKAVPSAPSASAEGTSPVKEEAYRRALRLALRDRVLSREEEVHLHEVAEHMGIGAGRAMALRLEVEREIGGGGAGARAGSRSRGERNL